MTVSTFIVEWDSEKLCSLVVAEETLRQKVMELRRMKLALANKEYDELMEAEE